MSERFDVVVIGAGPGGYVAAIRCAQLGLRTACIEKESALGGTCLRVGCIPSKALLESSERLVEAQKHLKEHGIDVQGVSFDLAKMLGRKDKIVKGLTDGVAHLLKKNKVVRFERHGSLKGKQEDLYEVSIDANGDAQSILAKNVILATGSKVADLPGVRAHEQTLGYPRVDAQILQRRAPRQTWIRLV